MDPFLPANCTIRPTYSVKWAESVVKNTIEKHSRGSKFFLEFSHLSVRTLAMVLARNRGEWHTIRRFIANVDRLYNCYADKPDNGACLTYNLTFVKVLFVQNARNSRIKSFSDWAEGLTRFE